MNEGEAEAMKLALQCFLDRVDGFEWLPMADQLDYAKHNAGLDAAALARALAFIGRYRENLAVTVEHWQMFRAALKADGVPDEQLGGTPETFRHPGTAAPPKPRSVN